MIEQVKHETLWLAIAAASAEVNNPKKNAVNPHLKNSFSDLKEIMATVKPVLWRHGLAVIQEIGGTAATTITKTTTTMRQGAAKGDAPETVTETTHETGAATVTTILIHAATGQRIESVQSLRNHQPGTNDAQSAGIAITYMRRYAILALLGIVGDMDGDGSEYDWLPREVSPVVTRAEEVAAKGLEAFREHYKGLSQADRTKLAPEIDRLKQIAEGAKNAKD